MVEQRNVRGKWGVSPLREAKTLLGVLKQQGLAGKGLIEAFEKWAPRIVGSSRADITGSTASRQGARCPIISLRNRRIRLFVTTNFPLKQKSSGKSY